jgi:hypothetical protein
MTDQHNYPNPLDNFRSYSYHFTLVVGNTTEAYRKLLTPTESGSVSFRDIVSQTRLGEKINGMDAYVILDTKRYSHFTVDSFECHHIFGTGKIQNPTVPSVAHKMRVTDTTGLSFFNFLMDIMKNKLQSTRASAFFLLSVEFVGHRDDGTTKVIDKCFMNMFLLNLGFKFASSGSVFDLEFIEVSGNPGQRIPSINDLGGTLTISTEKRANTVGGMIQALEDFLNISSLQFYNKYSNDALKGSKGSKDKKVERAGKLVQYMITIPEEWQNFTLDTADKSKNIEQVFVARKKENEKNAKKLEQDAIASGKSTEAAAKARASYLSLHDNLSIQDALSMILESSKEFLDLASFERRLQGEAVLHKTVAGVTSDSNTYVIHFDVYPYRAPKIEVKDDPQYSDAMSRRLKYQVASPKKAAASLPDGRPRNLITYDYLFTGRNSQILDLDIQFSPTSVVGLDRDLEIGDKRFANISQAGASRSEMDKQSSPTTEKTPDFNPNIRPSDPIFFPIKLKDEKTNHAGERTEELSGEQARAVVRAKREYSATMAFLHFTGSLQTQLTIRGNPNLIRKYGDVVLRGGIPPHPSSLISANDLEMFTTTLSAAPDIEKYFKNRMSTRFQSAKLEYFNKYVKPKHDDEMRKSADDPLLDGSDVATCPVFVKINIKAPNFDLAGNVIDPKEMYTQKFFYQGYYMILAMTTSFENGTFKHVLSLVPVDYDGSFSNATTTAPTEPIKKKEDVPPSTPRADPPPIPPGRTVTENGGGAAFVGPSTGFRRGPNRGVGRV